MTSVEDQPCQDEFEVLDGELVDDSLAALPVATTPRASVEPTRAQRLASLLVVPGVQAAAAAATGFATGALTLALLHRLRALHVAGGPSPRGGADTYIIQIWLSWPGRSDA